MLFRFWLTLLGFGLAQSALAAPTFGSKLGEVDFMDWKNGFVLKLPACADDKNVRVQELKLVVNDRKINIDRMKVVLHSGEQLDIAVNREVAVGKDQPWIKLREVPWCMSVLRLIQDEKATHIPEPRKVVMTIWGR